MQLVIDIPEEIYEEAVKSGYSHLYDEDVANAVANGIPLSNEEKYERIVIKLQDEVFEQLTKYGEPLPSGNRLYDAVIKAVVNGVILQKVNHDIKYKAESEIKMGVNHL